MGRITWDLIRKKTEHHDGLLEELEELSLHQLSLEKLEVIGRACPRLKILLLQNNLIPKIENIKRLKSLIYLNLALNNLTSISPEIGSLEKLRKLDLTMNFLDVDALESSVGALAQLEHLEDLYLTGNPVTQHANYRAYVVHRLPQLAKLDGEEVSTGERIRARQMWPEVEREVHAAAAAMRAEKQTDAAALAAEEEARPDGKDDDDLAEEAEAAGKTPEEAYMERAKKVTAYTPEARTQMVKEQEEMEQKKEEERRRARSGKDREDPWRDAQKKLNTKVDVSTLGDELPRQRNLGKLEFTVQETPLSVVYDIAVPRFMDTSLLDVDVHPRWFQLQCKGSLLLLHFPEEVEVAQTKLQRIQNTGHLLITCKKVRKLTQSAAGAVPSQKAQGEDGDDEDADAELGAASAAVVPSSTTSSSSSSSSSGSTVLDFSSNSSVPRRAGGGSTLNMVTADYRHIARPKAASSGAAMRELTAVRSATLEEKRRLDAEQAAKERRERAQRDSGVDPEEERRELERLGLDDTGVPDLE